MLKKIREASLLFRNAYGNLPGLVLWAELLKEKYLPMGALFKVWVPGYRAPVWLRAKTSDVEVFCQIFGHRELDFYRNPEARYIIDAGANIGLTSVFLAHRCPRAEIDALEIDAENVHVLHLNTAAYPRIRVIEKGLWRTTGYIRILNPNAESWAFMVGEAKPSEVGVIPAVAVGDLLRERGLDRIDLLKMDIEGAEREVLSRDFVDWLPAVKVMAVELHDHFAPGCAVSGKRAAFFSSAAPTSTMPAIVDDAEASDERTKATS